MKLDRVVFRYITDTNARFQAMKAGEGQAMEPQAQLQIADFQKDTNFVVKAVAGYSYEHLDIQFGPKGAAAAQGAVRPAGAHHRDQPSADRLGALPDDRSRPADAAEQHLQDLREGLQSSTTPAYPFNQTKVISIAEGQGLHRWARQAERGQRQDLLVPGRRQAVLPLLDDRR